MAVHKKDRHTMIMCCHVYTILNNLDCLGSTHNIFKYANTKTRSSLLSVCLLSSRINVYYRYSFFVNSPYMWNSLRFIAYNVFHISSYNSFKRNVRNFFFEKYYLLIVFLLVVCLLVSCFCSLCCCVVVWHVCWGIQV